MEIADPAQRQRKQSVYHRLKKSFASGVPTTVDPRFAEALQKKTKFHETIRLLKLQLVNYVGQVEALWKSQKELTDHFHHLFVVSGKPSAFIELAQQSKNCIDVLLTQKLTDLKKLLDDTSMKRIAEMSGVMDNIKKSEDSREDVRSEMDYYKAKVTKLTTARDQLRLQNKPEAKADASKRERNERRFGEKESAYVQINSHVIESLDYLWDHRFDFIGGIFYDTIKAFSWFTSATSTSLHATDAPLANIPDPSNNWPTLITLNARYARPVISSGTTAFAAVTTTPSEKKQYDSFNEPSFSTEPRLRSSSSVGSSSLSSSLSPSPATTTLSSTSGGAASLPASAMSAGGHHQRSASAMPLSYSGSSSMIDHNSLSPAPTMQNLASPSPSTPTSTSSSSPYSALFASPTPTTASLSSKALAPSPTTTTTTTTTPTPVWSSHVDPKTGATFYANALTKEVTWYKPNDFDGVSGGSSITSTPPKPIQSSITSSSTTLPVLPTAPVMRTPTPTKPTGGGGGPPPLPAGIGMNSMNSSSSSHHGPPPIPSSLVSSSSSSHPPPPPPSVPQYTVTAVPSVGAPSLYANTYNSHTANTSNNNTFSNNTNNYNNNYNNNNSNYNNNNPMMMSSALASAPSYASADAATTTSSSSSASSSSVPPPPSIPSLATMMTSSSSSNGSYGGNNTPPPSYSSSVSMSVPPVAPVAPTEDSQDTPPPASDGNDLLSQIRKGSSTLRRNTATAKDAPVAKGKQPPPLPAAAAAAGTAGSGQVGVGEIGAAVFRKMAGARGDDDDDDDE